MPRAVAHQDRQRIEKTLQHQSGHAGKDSVFRRFAKDSHHLFQPFVKDRFLARGHLGSLGGEVFGQRNRPPAVLLREGGKVGEKEGGVSGWSALKYP